MAITNLAVIETALRHINVIAEGDNATPAQGSTALNMLNDMMEMMKEDDFDVGYFAQSATTGNCPIPDWSRIAIPALLAVYLAPTYAASISQELSGIVASSNNLISRKSISEKLENADMSHMPIGTGHWGRGYDIAKGE